MALPLVAGVDGSDSSLQAVDWAADEAALHGLPLRLVYATLWERYEGLHPSFSTARPDGMAPEEHVAVVAERARLRKPQVDVTAEVVHEEAVAALLSAGRTASAVVVGSRGRGAIAGALLGSVSLAVAARAACPVTVVRGSEQSRRNAFGRVTVGVGDPAGGVAAVRFAVREARARGCALTAVRAWRSPAHEPMGHPLIAGDVSQAHEEQAADLLVDASAGTDLIVVGARRRHGDLGLQLGRTAHAVLHHSACPVAVVPEAGRD
jgi:nucleotide-binding universal stress UspA family protein